MSAAPIFDPGIVEVDDGVHLVGASCRACARWSFPLRGDCPWCGGPVMRSRLPQHGAIVSFTVLHLPLPFLGGPTAVALVALDEDVHVQGVVRTAAGEVPALAIGDQCRVGSFEVPTGDGPRVVYCFEPIDA